jgi:DNA helicase HerA-like ATPase
LLVFVYVERNILKGNRQMEQKNTTSEDSFPKLISSDFSADTNQTVPAGFEVVGNLVHFNGTPNFRSVAALLEPEHEVRPGQFLGVWHGRRDCEFLTIIQVADCLEVNPNELPDLSAARERLGLSKGYAIEGVSTRIYRLANCNTLEDFALNLTVEPYQVVNMKSPESLCRAGDPVVLIPPALATKIIGGLQEPKDGIHLGKLYGPQSFDVTLPPEILQTHALVTGNPSMGKSYLSGVLIEEAHNWDIPVLAIDVNGEFIEAAESCGGLVIRLPDKKNFGISLDLITSPELVQIAPNTQRGTQYAELIEIAHDQARKKSSGKRIEFSDLNAEVDSMAKLLGLGPATAKTAKSRLSGLEKDEIIGSNFDFVKKLRDHKIVVLDCRFLSLRQTRLIASTAARVLQKYGKKMALKAGNGEEDAASWFALLFIDEAHLVVPDDEGSVSTQVLYELARMGRHVRTGLVLSTQSPSDLNTSVLKRLQTRFVFALERDQLRTIGGIHADFGEEIIQQLPKFPRGVCAVSGSSQMVRHGFILSVRKRKTPVGGGTPPVFEERRKKQDQETPNE